MRTNMRSHQETRELSGLEHGKERVVVPMGGGGGDLCLVMILTMIFLLLCRSTSSTGTETHSKLNLGIFKSDSELCADKNNGRILDEFRVKIKM